MDALINLNKKDSENALRVYQDLNKAYSEGHRFYHNTMHIKNMLEILEELAKKIPSFYSYNIDLFILAIIEHDVVYIPGFYANEKASFCLASIHSKMLGLSVEDTEYLKNLILSTEHTQERNEYLRDGDAGLYKRTIRDLDLSILGSTWENFLEYDDNIKKEYVPYVTPEEKFKLGRKNFLDEYLKMSPIFMTEFFYDNYETAAKENLRRIIDSRYP